MQQYSFAGVDLVISGVPINGFANSNNIITCGRNTPQHARVVDARGKMSVVTSVDHTGFIQFELLQGSPGSAWMQIQAIKSQNSGGRLEGAEYFIPLQAAVNDKMGRCIMLGLNGFIPMQPSVVRGTGMNVEVWRIEFEVLSLTRGAYAIFDSGADVPPIPPIDPPTYP